MGSFNVALLEALLSAGLPHERARAVVDLFDRSVDERYGLHAQVLATRRDVAELETRLDAQVLATRRDEALLNRRRAARASQPPGARAPKRSTTLPRIPFGM